MAKLKARQVEIRDREIESARNHALISDAQFWAFTFSADPQALEEICLRMIGQLDRRLPPTHHGIAAILNEDGRYAISFWFVHRALDLKDPIPTKLPAGARLHIEGPLRRGYFRPSLLIALPSTDQADGPIVEQTITMLSRDLITEITLDQPGIYGLELLANSQYGPIVLQNATITVGDLQDQIASHPFKEALTLSETDIKRPKEQQLALLINRLRQKEGRPPLRRHPKLEKAAQLHAEELSAQGHLQHFSPNTGALATRLEGVNALHLAENLAFATTPTEALQAFLQSPAHKRNLLLRSITHFGIGLYGNYYAVAFAAFDDPQDP